MSNGHWVHNGSSKLDDESQYRMIMSVSIILTILMSVIVSLRIYVRGTLLRSIGADDWAILGAAACSISYNALCIAQTRWGLGLTLALRPKANLADFAVVNFAGKPIYIAGILGFKVSLCLSYLRILANSSRGYRHVIWLVLVACVAGHFGGILVLIFLCSPIEKSWKPRIPGHCIPNVNSIYGLGAVSIFFDIVILCLPIPMVMKLKINNRKRIGLFGIFCLGIFTTVCSIMRLAQVKSILATGDQTGLVLWATVELNVGISLTCLPTLLPLVKYFRDKKSTSQGTYPLKDTSSNRLGFLKSQTHTNVTTNDPTPGWKDRDSIDNSSQKQILGMQQGQVSAHSDDTLGHAQGGHSKGITTTREVQVEVSRLSDDDSRPRPNGSRW
ncbi:integral membrane protein [Phlyctema vagabunda]|uniref:Integral membrane protein n=1 Tax=Phlyctema vagabunda TaxID=108571 RepID=A0ABR4PDE8_9HELO